MDYLYNDCISEIIINKSKKTRHLIREGDTSILKQGQVIKNNISAVDSKIDSLTFISPTYYIAGSQSDTYDGDSPIPGSGSASFDFRNLIPKSYKGDIKITHNLGDEFVLGYKYQGVSYIYNIAFGFDPNIATLFNVLYIVSFDNKMNPPQYPDPTKILIPRILNIGLGLVLDGNFVIYVNLNIALYAS